MRDLVSPFVTVVIITCGMIIETCNTFNATILDILNEKLRPPLPPISMMERWRVLLCARIHHGFGWGGGEGGFNFSFYSVQDCRNTA